MTTPITVAYGDGIGPEIMEAVLYILKEAKARISIETIEVGEKVYKMGNTTGIPNSAWESLRRTKVLLKAPITTPQGGGYKSLNVTMRKALGLYANVRPVASYHPFVKTFHPKMDLVIVRENEEDLYAGIEYRQSHDSYQSLKIITRSGSERIIRYAFEYAVCNGRRKVTCMSKDNIMKLADGCFHKLFDQIGAEYPQIEKEHYIIDIGAARIASSPSRFDVIVTENLYGDIISDIAAEVSGSVGLAGSSNIGYDFAMFEAIHGSAPDIAGKGIANPSGLLGGAIMMLVHIGQPDVATLVHNAWLRTLEDGIHTGDVYGEHSKQKVGTKDFAQAVVDRLGQAPATLNVVKYAEAKEAKKAVRKSERTTSEKKELIGVDVFVHWQQSDIQPLVKTVAEINGNALALKNISSKGLKVWPDGGKDMNVTDQFRCRFLACEGVALTHGHITTLLGKMADKGLDFVKTENLYAFDGTPAYSLGQGE